MFSRPLYIEGGSTSLQKETAMPNDREGSQPHFEKRGVGAKVFVQCENCKAGLFTKHFEESFRVCQYCDFHHHLSGIRRVIQLVDTNTFEQSDADLTSSDPLVFVSTKPYKEELREAYKTSPFEAVITGMAFIKGRRLILCCMNYQFMAGSMGSVVGEKTTRAIERAEDETLPLIIVSSSSGARMQESGFSLMQMAKISAALAKFGETGGLYISLITDPTLGGVTSSFAMLGDVIFAEPGAQIRFAGPRVTEGITKERIPREKTRSEALLKHGFIDRVVHRHQLRSEISAVIDYCLK